MNSTIPKGTSLGQLLDFEKIVREEIKWEEEKISNTYRIRFLARMKDIKNRKDLNEKQQTLVRKRIQQTYIRHAKSVEVEEQKSRIKIMQNEQLRLEAIMIDLENAIQDNIFNATNSIQLGINYFNKTVELIFKTESSERKTIHGSEQYEFLCKIQLFDRQYRKFLQLEIQKKVQESKKESYKKIKELSLFGCQREHISDIASKDIKSSNDGSSSPYNGKRPITKKYCTGRGKKQKVQSQISCKFSHEYFHNCFKSIQARELFMRENIQLEEDDSNDALIALMDHFRRRDAQNNDHSAEEIIAKYERLFVQLHKREQHDRVEIELLCGNGWDAIKRKHIKARYHQIKSFELQQNQQKTHMIKLANRYNRIAYQQHAFAQKEGRIISEIIDVENVLRPVSAQVSLPSSASVRNEHEKKKIIVLEECKRQRIAQEEKTMFYMIYEDMLADSSDCSVIDAKLNAARLRREAQELQQQEILMSSLGSSYRKSDSTKAECDRRTRLKLEIEIIQNDEASHRVKEKKLYLEWCDNVVASLKSAKRLSRTIHSIEWECDDKRERIMKHERYIRSGIIKAIKLKLSPMTKKAFPPLPNAPVSFDKAKKIYAEFMASHLTDRKSQADSVSRDHSTMNSSIPSWTSSPRGYKPPIHHLIIYQK